MLSKPTIQLVPATDPATPRASAPDNSEATPQSRADIPVSVPTAMSSSVRARQPALRDRNAATKPDESASTHKENTGVRARQPALTDRNALKDRNAATKPDESASTNKVNKGVRARVPATPTIRNNGWRR